MAENSAHEKPETWEVLDVPPLIQHSTKKDLTSADTENDSSSNKSNKKVS